jgi:citrate lyase beta subunit
LRLRARVTFITAATCRRKDRVGAAMRALGVFLRDAEHRLGLDRRGHVDDDAVEDDAAVGKALRAGDAPGRMDTPGLTDDADAAMQQRQRRGRERETGVMALVETTEGLSNIEAIAAVDGLLALVIGPFDLSVSLGFEGDYRHRDVQAAIDRMLAAARKARLPVIAPIFNPDVDEAKRQQEEWRAKGVSHFVVGTDKIIFANAAARYARALS